jgi:LPS-assembly protein
MRPLLQPLTRQAHPHAVRAVAWTVALLVLQPLALGAQELPASLLETPPLQLKSSPQLQEQIAPSVRKVQPTFITGDLLSGRPDLETQVQGQAVLRRGDLVIKADQLDYDQAQDLGQATGHVRVNRAGNVYEGPSLQLKLDTFEGFFQEPRYFFYKNQAHGSAERVTFVDEQRTVITQATYTTCRRLPGPSWMPDWILRAATLTLDNDENVGTAENVVLSFKELPLLPLPFVSFPLSDQRKSGFLPPTPSVDNVNGTMLGIPYYWNIAPNRDATLTPTLMTKRGLNLASQFRYLEADYSGQAQFNLMPTDRLRDSSRWGLSATHNAALDNPFGPGSASLSLNLNRVGDDNYWRDFTQFNTSLTQRLLSNDVSLSWSQGSFANSLRAVKWQTLQDTASVITPPYDRLPQLTTRYAPAALNGFNYSVDADFTNFQSVSALTGQPNAQRAFSLLQISRPWTAPFGYLTPKLQLHAASYQFDAALSSTGSMSGNHVVPTFSLDSGLVFERESSLGGMSFLQTLEPRAFYVKTPYRSQSKLPNYDTAASDFNFTSIYSENAFVGNDRISDNNLLTLGLTSRFMNQGGAELARFSVAQRLRLEEQRVTLADGGAAVASGLSDVLLGATLNLNPQWTLDSTVQYNPATSQSTRATASARYSPGNYRVVTAAYRYQRDASEQIDIGWQWPLNDLWGDRGQDLGAGRGQGEGRWYGVGRLNYSLPDAKVVDMVLGIEYDAGCWVSRVVVERLQTSTSTANQRIMFQMEFVGFTRLGVNPLKTLKDNIPNYQYLREQSSSPSRFSHYD